MPLHLPVKYKVINYWLTGREPSEDSNGADVCSSDYVKLCCQIHTTVTCRCWSTQTYLPSAWNTHVYQMNWMLTGFST